MSDARSPSDLVKPWVLKFAGLNLLVGGIQAFISTAMPFSSFFLKPEGVGIGFVFSVAVSITLHALSAFCGWKLLAEQKNWRGLAGPIVLLQTVSFQLGGFSYLFPNGIAFSLGFANSGVAFNWVLFVIQTPALLIGVDVPFRLMFNLVAIFEWIAIKKFAPRSDR